MEEYMDYVVLVLLVCGATYFRHLGARERSAVALVDSLTAVVLTVAAAVQLFSIVG